MNGENSDWIFYLKLSKKLPAHFFTLDKEMKDRGLTLVPISISELISITKGEGKFHVMTSVRSISDAQYFSKKINKIFSMLLRSRRLNLFIASSFSFINQTHLYGKTKQYHYFELPSKVNKICDKIALEVSVLDSTQRKWPGASRGLGATIV